MELVGLKSVINTPARRKAIESVLSDRKVKRIAFVQIVNILIVLIAGREIHLGPIGQEADEALIGGVACGSEHGEQLLSLTVVGEKHYYPSIC